MALLKCKKCKNDIGWTDKKCSICGEATVSLIYKGILFFILVMIIGNYQNHQSTSSYTSQSDYTHQASSDTAQSDSPLRENLRMGMMKGECEYQIKKTLNDPDSAEFDDTDTFPVTYKNGVYHTEVYMRGRNGFNAMRRATFKCDMVPDGPNDWKSVGIKQIH